MDTFDSTVSILDSVIIGVVTNDEKKLLYACMNMNLFIYLAIRVED